MSAPLPLSLVLITRDAAPELAACIASASFAAEIVVVDSGSADDTVAMAQCAGARVIEHPWAGFGPQKNFAVGQARHDWVLCLDADERVTPALAASIVALFDCGLPAAPAYALARRNRFLGRWLAHGEGYPDWNVRLFDRRVARWTSDPVHEHVVTEGSVVRLAGDLEHTSAESIEAYMAKQNRYTSLQAAAMHARGERAGAWRIVVSPVARFFRFYVIKGGWLDGIAGFTHIGIGAFASFLKYTKLRALDQDSREGRK
ncbi:MAG: glycosyltransferase family 2 protein [Betaproteobacteria bacterium]